MRTLPRQHASVAVLLTASLLGVANACVGKDPETAGMLDKQVLQLEQLWKAGKRREYYVEASKMANDIISESAKGNKNAAAAQLLESLLTRAAVSPKVTYDDLFTTRKVASYLVSNANVSAEDRRTNARLLSKYLGEIRKEIVQGYKPKRVTRNVAPPLGVPGVAGMNPDAIDDPVARAQYKEAIRKNQEDGLMNARQRILRDMEREMSARVVAYLIEAFQAHGTPRSLVNECIKNAQLTDAEREELESKITDP